MGKDKLHDHAVSPLSEKINTKCGDLKGDAKKKCVNVVRNRHNLDAHREQSYVEYDRERHEYNEKVEEYGQSFVNAVDYVKDKMEEKERASELHKKKKGVWDVKGRKRTREDEMFDEALDANFRKKMRTKKYKDLKYPHLQSKKKK